MPEFGTVLTAVVTPFDADGAVDESAFVRILEHLAATGSDGVVVAGTTGEASTLTDEEHLAVIDLAVKERPDDFTIIAGAGSNDTHHACQLTSKASALGVDGILSVTPYYNRPPRRGIIRHYEEVAKSTELPIIVYNIPARTGTDMPNDLLEELGRIENIVGVKQSNNDNLAMVDGLQLYAGNDEVFAKVLDLGGSGGILTATHVVGPEFKRMVNEPENRDEIHNSLLPVFDALGVAPAASADKAALNLMGLPGGHVRLPYVDCDESETATIRAML
ncbi:MAG: 4-hydroxy-tetrahydrodipicolinate synthase, partial [Thermoleophilaceae bacterium]|nr:4-hydroxy-tetrahydrodipicolinate synthase [Thermoleophilaceae bacterium]